MLQLTDLVKTYSKGRVRAVDGLSLTVNDGEIFGFIGPNGAGKTTTIKIIAGILSPDSGSVLINGKDIKKQPVEARMQLGYVPDEAAVYERLTGMEYLLFIADMYGVPPKERGEAIEKYLAMFSLGSAASDQIRSYSHGMKQKLMLAAALLHRPPLWILDEPLTGLDPKSSHLLKEEMRAHCAPSEESPAGNTVFFSTHVLEVAERLCDRIAIIDKGKIIASGTLEELRGGTDSTLEALFLRLTEEADGE